MVSVDEDLLTIGEFAALSRLSIKALRLYDEQGLIAPTRIDPGTRYRYYSADQIPRAVLVGSMRRADVPLALIREVLDSTNPEDAVRSFEEWWVRQERRHAARRGIGRYIVQRLRNQGEPEMDIATRVVPERKLAVIGKELFQPELEAFIMGSFDALFGWAERHSGLRELDTTPEWPSYVIFHGPVTPDQISLVECCVVIDGPAEPEGDIALRVEAEHQEAYTTLTKKGIEFPAILDAYGAVAAWVHENGAMLERLPSREVYFTNVLTAGDDDPVCDVAFPYEPR